MQPVQVNLYNWQLPGASLPAPQQKQLFCTSLWNISEPWWCPSQAAEVICQKQENPCKKGHTSLPLPPQFLWGGLSTWDPWPPVKWALCLDYLLLLQVSVCLGGTLLPYLAGTGTTCTVLFLSQWEWITQTGGMKMRAVSYVVKVCVFCIGEGWSCCEVRGLGTLYVRERKSLGCFPAWQPPSTRFASCQSFRLCSQHGMWDQHLIWHHSRENATPRPPCRLLSVCTVFGWPWAALSPLRGERQDTGEMCVSANRCLRCGSQDCLELFLRTCTSYK